jgi:hypothetical protein
MSDKFKVKITGLPEGFSTKGLSPEGLNEMISTAKPPKKEIKIRNENMDTDKKVSRLGNEKWEKEYYAPFREWLKKNKGIDATFKTHEEYQQAIAKHAPELLLEKLKSGEMLLTNRHRQILGLSDDITDFTEIPPAKLKEMGENVDNILIDGYIDKIPGHRGLNITDYNPNKTQTTKEETPATPTTTPTATPEGNKYDPADNSFQLPPYERRKLPFYQVAPDLANFASANQLYNYWTPDYTHQEIQPPTLNIQDQLSSMDSSLASTLRTTTGNPILDQARKNAVFSQVLDAKDQAYARKQNYDAEGRFKADEFNIGARNKEMVDDINAASTIHNEYVSQAKDNMTYEKMASIQNMYKKYMMNEATENRYEMLSKMFPNISFNPTTGGVNVNTNNADFRFPNRNQTPTNKTNLPNPVKPTVKPNTFGGVNKVNTLPVLEGDSNAYDLLNDFLPEYSRRPNE